MTGERRAAAAGTRWSRATLGAMAALILLTVAGQVLAVADGTLRPVLLGVSLLVLDLAGAVFGFRASARSAFARVPWVLIASGRVFSVLANLGLSASSLTGEAGWWWAGTASHLLMFVSMSGGVLFAAVRQFGGRRRVALIAEVSTVAAAGFIVIWYFALEPFISRRQPSPSWVYTLGSHLGDVLLLAAVASVLLRGAVTRYALPIVVNAAGLAVLLVADVSWSASSGSAEQTAARPFASISFVTAALLLTLAPMIAVAAPPRPVHSRRETAPPWAIYLPTSAMFLACGLLLVISVVQDQVVEWGGLMGGLTVMACAIAVRQITFMRDSRDTIVSDPLTGLANRVGLDHRAERAVRQREPMALLLIDLDGFKLVNDAYGHAAGDAVLVHFAGLVRAAVRSGDLPARIGGDEFAVLLPGVGETARAVAVAERVLAGAAASPARIGDDLLPVRASIGVAVTAGHPLGRMELTRRADVAMYHSKRAGGHGCTAYHPSMTDRRTEDAALSEDLGLALDRGELHLLFQPIVTLADGRPTAAEALLRWEHPGRGAVPPARFIPLAERSGAILRIGLWVLEEALTQLPVLAGAGGRPFHVSVNLSPRQLREPTIVPDVLAVLRRTGTDPRHLVLEITESAIVDEDNGLGALHALRDHGIRVAIDDFGTGYSSLQYLTRLPVDILKIDRSFVAELDDTPEGAGVAEAVIRLAHVLHMSTIAEGIETPEQAAELRALGCERGQGYLYARPLPPAELAALIAGPQPAVFPAG